MKSRKKQGKLNHLKLSKQISRIIFKDVPMKEKVIRDKTVYRRKEKHRKFAE